MVDTIFSFLIDRNPKLIRYYRGVDARIIDKALASYIPTEADLKRNPSLCSNLELMEKIISSNSDLVKYIRLKNSIGSYVLQEKIDDAMARGYKPQMSDLVSNPDLGYSIELIGYLVKNGSPEAIKYYRGFNYFVDLAETALKQYTPTFSDLVANPNLGRAPKIIEAILPENKDAIKYLAAPDETLVEKAIDVYHFELKSSEVSKLDSNAFLRSSTVVFEKLIQEDANNILFYAGKDENIYKQALDNGYEPKVNHLDENKFLRGSDSIMQVLIDEDPFIVKSYTGSSDAIFEKAFNLGFNGDEFFNYYTPDKFEFGWYTFSEPEYYKSSFLCQRLIDHTPSIIEQLPKLTPQLIDYAINQAGYNPTSEFFRKALRGGDEIYPRARVLLKKDPSLIKSVEIDYRTASLYVYAIKNGYVPSEDEIRNNSFINKDVRIMYALAQHLPEMVKYYAGDNVEVYLVACRNGYLPTPDQMENYREISSDTEAMLSILKSEPNYIKYYNGNNTEVYLAACNNGYLPPEDEVARVFEYSNDSIMRLIVDKRPYYIKYYHGMDSEVYIKAFKSNFISEDFLLDNKWLTGSSKFMGTIVKEYPDWFKYYTGSDKELIESILSGDVPSLDEITFSAFDFITVEGLKNIVDKSSVEQAINFMFSALPVPEEVKSYIMQKYNFNISDGYMDLLKGRALKSDLTTFVFNMDLYETFLSRSGIDESLFVQYGFGSNHDWMSDMIEIMNSEKLDEFLTVKDALTNSLFKMSSQSNALQVRDFIIIMKNYIKYPELCLDILNNPNILEYKDQLSFLFESNVEFGNNRPKSVEDLKNIGQLLMDKFTAELNGVDYMSAEEVKELLCNMLFNRDLDSAKENLSIFGDTKVLRQLMFNNRDNLVVCDAISDIMVCTSFMEAIVSLEDKDQLVRIAQNAIANIELCSKCMMLFSGYESKMQQLYAMDLQANLTKIDYGKDYSSLLDEQMTKEYGVEVIDFSDKRYCLLAHVKSESESLDTLIFGLSSGSFNTICQSAISNRNQVYYNSGGIIFGYDSHPAMAFIQSSVSNMGSNGSINNNSVDYIEISSRKQRGILETSGAPNDNNSEVLSFREGIKPSYIILPGGRRPTDEEVEIAKKYGLRFAKTQTVRLNISNPKQIDSELLDKAFELNSENSREYVDDIKALVSSLSSKSGDGVRRVAVFADAHGLFEPTLAILEDARRSGITEIYSLGDNIGTGPNPSEVLDLLDTYGVQSVVGNHELYTLYGVEKYKDHLMATDGYEEARDNSEWTRAQLTPEQLESLEALPDSIEVEIGNEKVLLTHFTRDYNSGEPIPISDDVTRTLQGHKHFENESEKAYTLRGVGIGGGDLERAFYIVLTENADGSIKIERKTVDYDKRNMRYDIIESDMNEHDKEKMQEWAGVSR